MCGMPSALAPGCYTHGVCGLLMVMAVRQGAHITSAYVHEGRVLLE